MTAVQGDCDPAFAAVREVFASNLAAGRDLGAAVAVFVDGRPVVDLWGGVADKRSGRAWERDTPCVAFSCTKAVTAAAALLLATRRAVDLDGRVVDWWPEYAANGKGATTATDLLTHRAGLPAFDRPIPPAAAADATAMAAQLAGQVPEWQPGTAHGYHALTFGWLVGELVRRHSGQSVGAFVRAEFGEELHIGAPQTVLDRAARITAADRSPTRRPHEQVPYEKRSLFERATANPAASFNDPVVLTGGWPAAGLVTTARALAGFYRDLVAGTVVQRGAVRDAIVERVRGRDRTLGQESAFGLGFMRPSAVFPITDRSPDTAFGHPGSGGSAGVGDLEHGLAYAFIPNLRNDPIHGDSRARDLLDAAYASL